MESKSKNWLDLDARENHPCPICGATDFYWGMTDAEKFSPDNASLLTLVGILLGGIKLEARMCAKCGNVQLFTKAHVPQKKKSPPIEKKDYFTWLREQENKES